MIDESDIQELIEWLESCKGSAEVQKEKPYQDYFEIVFQSGIVDICEDVIRRLNNLLKEQKI